ncbi:hypothetical protein PoB_003504900 [Plakobranchus ocellatus]|uniref:Uncharacterized protein n=1 Tax=Plakobranchus ocellatus TaxID=259542 RepID=A0AAV4AQF0_9GAST|nr:hypothetical protein PoB_003504900 [Plakobranchus ocellatus]
MREQHPLKAEGPYTSPGRQAGRVDCLSTIKIGLLLLLFTSSSQILRPLRQWRTSNSRQKGFAKNYERQIRFGFGLFIELVHNKVISGFQALRWAWRDTDGGVRTRDRMVPADFRADLPATVPLVPPRNR